MAKYRVTMVEKTFYKFYVEANSEEEAEAKAEEDFGNGGGEVTDCYVSDINTEEES